MIDPRRLPALAALCVLATLTPPLLAQAASLEEPPPAATAPVAATSDAAPAANPATGRGFSPEGEAAFALFEQGDLAGALARLEGSPRAALSAVDLALLGTLYLESDRPDQAWPVLQPLAEPAAADPAVLYNAARAALLLGKQKIGIALLERSVQKAPLSPAGRELGLIAGSVGQFDVAYALLRPWSAANPRDGEARLAAAAAALQTSRLRDAELLLRGLETATDPRAILLQGQLALLSGRPEEAVARVEPILAAPPAEMADDLHRLVADAYVQLGRAAEATPLVASCAGRDPRCALLQSEALYRTGDLAGAVTALAPHAGPALAGEGAPDLRGRVAQAHGRMLVAAARYEEALPSLELAVELLADEAVSWKALADALAALGRREEAAAALERLRAASAAAQEERREREAALRDPAGAALAAAEAQLAAGNGEAALFQIRQEIALAPGELRPRVSEIRALLGLGRQREALAAATAAVAAFPEDADALYMRAAAHLLGQEREPAEADLRQALQLAPGHVPAMSDLAVLLLASGRKDEARQLLGRVLELRPDDERAAATLRELEGGGG